MSIEQIDSFWKKLATDRSFRLQIQNAQSKAEYKNICEAFDFNFTQEELKELTNFLSELNLTDADIKDLSKLELGAVVGGQMQQVYGTTRPTRPRLTV